MYTVIAVCKELCLSMNSNKWHVFHYEILFQFFVSHFLLRLREGLLVMEEKKKLNSVAVVRKRTIPTERPPLVGEVSANLCG
jgi:hypothetical protein